MFQILLISDITSGDEESKRIHDVGFDITSDDVGFDITVYLFFFKLVSVCVLKKLNEKENTEG